LGGIRSSFGVGDVGGFSCPGSEGAIVSWGRLRNVVLEACSDKIDMGIDPGLDAGIFVEDLVIN
jgi:hypothetical protein